MAISESSSSDRLFDTELAVSEVLDFLRQVSHNMLAGFPDVQRWDQTDDTFQLIWYLGMSRKKVAKILSVDLRTVQRRWRSARESLANRCGGMPPR